MVQQMLNPAFTSLIVEFFREVSVELTKAIKRRRSKRKRERERKEVLRKQIDQYERDLAKLKKTSRLPENPYGQ